MSRFALPPASGGDLGLYVPIEVDMVKFTRRLKDVEQSITVAQTRIHARYKDLPVPPPGPPGKAGADPLASLGRKFVAATAIAQGAGAFFDTIAQANAPERQGEAIGKRYGMALAYAAANTIRSLPVIGEVIVSEAKARIGLLDDILKRVGVIPNRPDAGGRQVLDSFLNAAAGQSPAAAAGKFAPEQIATPFGSFTTGSGTNSEMVNLLRKIEDNTRAASKAQGAFR